MRGLGRTAAQAVVMALLVATLWAAWPSAAAGSSDLTRVSGGSGLMVSDRSDRSHARAVEANALGGMVYVFANARPGIDAVHFYIDDAAMAGAPAHTDDEAPYDLAGGTAEHAAAFDTAQLSDGVHVLTAAFVLSDGRQIVVHANLAVDQAAAAVRPASDASWSVFYTTAELQMWRERAADGPYRSEGDVSEHSPGDWQRIADNASAFLADPSAARWNGPSNIEGGCITRDDSNSNNPPDDESTTLRDAAFYYLVTQEPAYRDAVRAELLSQAATNGTSFRADHGWCTGEQYDGAPSFFAAYWMTRNLLAYEYLGPQAFTIEEHERLRAWFRAAATFFETDLNDKLDDNFRDRRNGDYRPTDERIADPGLGPVAFAGGPQTSRIARYYNNRRAAQATFVAFAGAQQGIDGLQETGRLFVQEMIAFSIYPDGSFGEFERRRDDLPDLGWQYATYNVGNMVAIADALARAGDPSLFEYQTSAGVHGTEGGTKTLLSAMQAIGGYLDGTFDRYGTDDPAHIGDPEYRIDGVNGSDWESANDALIAQGNLYYRDPYVTGVYTRTGPGLRGYPERPAPNGAYHPWEGPGGIYPGVLFMYGQTERLVQPY